jgi:predicted kinase
MPGIIYNLDDNQKKEVNMRILCLLRGIPASGKSYFIHENNLEEYTLCADNFRLAFSSPVLLPNGDCCISQNNDKEVWDLLFSCLEKRMQQGQFTVVDATHIGNHNFPEYKDLAEKYKYRIYCVDFSDVSLETCLERNALRGFRKVPENVIRRMHQRMMAQKLPSWLKLVKREDFRSKVLYREHDFDCYENVYIIGDIHGCNTVLQEFLRNNGNLSEKNLYVFLGDYLDRGKENLEVLNFLISVMNKENVVLLEGNHENSIRCYLNNEAIRSHYFKYITLPEIEDKLDRVQLRAFYRKLAQCYCGCMTVGGRKLHLIMSHGGIPYTEKNPVFINASEFIKGVGRYEDYMNVARQWNEHAPADCIQFFGHRNTDESPVKLFDNVYNLEGQVEQGGCLRAVRVNSDGIYPLEYRNSVFKEKASAKKDDSMALVGKAIEEFRGSKLIDEKSFGDLSSFNFTRDAFNNSRWNSLTVLARGLYVDIRALKIVARGYDKFFNIDENRLTYLGNLKERLKFPLTVYKKENGFLVLISVYKDELFVTTKSNPEGKMAEIARELVGKMLSAEAAAELKNYLCQNNCTLLCEGICPTEDPHIISYERDDLIMLDLVKNDLVYEKKPFSELKKLSEKIGLKCKVQEQFNLTSFDEFCGFYKKYSEDISASKEEGFVIEDSSGFQVKLKTFYYRYWKQMRTVVGRFRKGESFKNSLPKGGADFGHWLQSKNPEELPVDIISIRDIYMKETGNIL